MVKLLSPAAFPPRRPSSLLRYAIAAVFVLALFYYFDPRSRGIPATQLQPEKPQTPPPKPDSIPPVNTQHDAEKPIPEPAPKPVHPIDDEPTKAEGAVPKKPAETHPAATGSHPIDTLIKEADERFNGLLKKESKTLTAAAKAYRDRRGRHPPPGFDAWFQFAQERKAVIVEDFFDQIYHDLRPFWGMEPSRIRKEAAEYEMTIKVRKGRATRISEWFWTVHWTNMIKTIEHLLPDMDIALNPMDEPRMVVPYEDMAQYMRDAALTEGMPEPKKVMNTFQALPNNKKELDRNVKVKSKHWEETSTCRPSAIESMICLRLTLSRTVLAHCPSRMSTRQPCAVGGDPKIVRPYPRHRHQILQSPHARWLRRELYHVDRNLPPT